MRTEAEAKLLPEWTAAETRHTERRRQASRKLDAALAEADQEAIRIASLPDKAFALLTQPDWPERLRQEAENQYDASLSEAWREFIEETNPLLYDMDDN